MLNLNTKLKSNETQGNTFYMSNFTEDFHIEHVKVIYYLNVLLCLRHQAVYLLFVKILSKVCVNISVFAGDCRRTYLIVLSPHLL